MNHARAAVIWGALAVAITVPIVAAANSELLAWRDPIYIGAGFAGIVALALLLVQPLLIGGYLPDLSSQRARRVHRWIGALVVASVTIHVVGLWITSPPDVIDVLLFRSPTPFSLWGVIAMWAVFIIAILAALRRRLAIRPRAWRIAHSILAVIVVAGAVIHAVLVEGTMETLSKAALCILVVAATLKVLAELRVWSRR